MSIPLREHFPAVAARVSGAAHLLLGLDFDGTLAAIVDVPSQAKLDLETRQAVEAIAALPDTTVAIVSGRGLHDVRGMVGIENLIYAGNHGLEICGPGFGYTEPTAIKAQRALGWLATALAKGLSQIPGVIVEYKALTISVHTRLVAPAEKAIVYRHVQAAAAVKPECFRISQGNEVFDLCPRVEWNKGSAMSWIAGQLGKQNLLTLYLGDDRTDEDAFQSIEDGITVKVGEPGNTCAQYHLDGPASVREFLAWLSVQGRQGGKP